MKKMDEMEMKMSLDAIKWAWSFTVIALAIWGIYDFVKLQVLTLPMYLLIAQNIVYFITIQISKWKVGDESGKKSLFLYLIAVVVCLLGFGSLILFLD